MNLCFRAKIAQEEGRASSPLNRGVRGPSELLRMRGKKRRENHLSFAPVEWVHIMVVGPAPSLSRGVFVEVHEFIASHNSAGDRALPQCRVVGGDCGDALVASW